MRTWELALAVLAASVAFGVVFAFRGGHDRHGRPHASCAAVVAGHFYWCDNGRAYSVYDGQWVDAGPLTPLPAVPRG